MSALESPALSPAAQPAEAAPADVLENYGADRLLDAVKRNCLIIYVTVHSWDGNYQIRNADVVVSGAAIPQELRSKSSWKLKPVEWHDRLVKYVSQVRAAVYRRAVNFKEGIYIVPRTVRREGGVLEHRARDLVRELKQLDQQYRSTAEDCARDWDRFLTDLRRPLGQQGALIKGLGDFYAHLQAKIPSRQKFVDLHSVEVGIWPVGGGERIEDRAEEWLEEAQAATDRMVRERVAAMVREPLAEFAEAVANLHGLVQGGRRLAPTSIDVVRRAWEKLQGFSFMLPNDMCRRLQEVDTALAGMTVGEVNRDLLVGQQLQTLMQRAGEEAAQELRSASGLAGLGRVLDLD